MEVLPVEAGRTCRDWQDQQVELAAAAGQVAEAPAAGFTPAVEAVAVRFTGAWRAHVAGLAADAESRADSLRAAVADLVRTDQGAGLDVAALGSLLRSVR